jgi:glutathione synthase
LKFLVLTDHSGHSKENSVYALMKKLAAQPQVETVMIASRGFEANDAFFDACATDKVYAIPVTENFGFDATKQQFSTTEHQVSIKDFDAILMRLPRPVSEAFLNFVAELGKDKVIINHPNGITKTSTKAFLLNFPSVCPDMKLCHSIEEILDFAAKFPIVLKPLKEYGGKGLLKINGTELNDGEANFDTATYLRKQKEYIETEGYLAMKFLKNVSKGDKRILVVNGKILAASLRLPAEDSWLCNVAQGGTSTPSEVDADEIKIIEIITPKLLAAGILIFGADTLVNDDGKRILSEVNTLSIGGFPQAEKQTGKPILQQTIDEIINYVNSGRG